MEIRLKTGLKNQTLFILNTYAPHMGYQSDGIDKYRNTLNKYIDAITKNYIMMWRTDNNGQVAHTTSDDNNNIGKWTIANMKFMCKINVFREM